MKTLHLRRFFQDSKVTLGAICDEDGVIAFSVEPPWLDNAPNKSCIPAGEFVATRVLSPRFGLTYDLDVPGRSLIRFHPGNAATESRGCPLVVSRIHRRTGLDSRSAFARLMAKLDGTTSVRVFVTYWLNDVV